MSLSDDSLVMTTLWWAEWAEIIYLTVIQTESFKQYWWVTTLKVFGDLGPERISCDDKKTGHLQNTM